MKAPTPSVFGVKVVEAIDADLERVLDRDQPLVRRDLVDEAAKRRGLPRPGSSGHDQVRSCPHSGGEELGEQLIADTTVDEFPEAADVEVMAADGDGRPAGHGHEGVEAVTVGELKVQLGVSVVPPTLTPADSPRCRCDQVDELLVRFGDGRASGLASIAHAQPDPLAPGDVDVSNLRIVEKWLEAGEAVEPIEDGGGQRRFAVLVQSIGPLGVRGARHAAKLFAEQLPAERTLVRDAEPLPTFGLVAAVDVGERIADRAVQPGDEAGIEIIGTRSSGLRRPHTHDTVSNVEARTEVSIAVASDFTDRYRADRPMFVERPRPDIASAVR